MSHTTANPKRRKEMKNKRRIFSSISNLGEGVDWNLLLNCIWKILVQVSKRVGISRERIIVPSIKQTKDKNNKHLKQDEMKNNLNWSPTPLALKISKSTTNRAEI